MGARVVVVVLLRGVKKARGNAYVNRGVLLVGYGGLVNIM